MRPTIIEHLRAAGAAIDALTFRGDRSSADRELSVAHTHIEDAMSRVCRAFAKHHGDSAVIDPQARP